MSTQTDHFEIALHKPHEPAKEGWPEGGDLKVDVFPREVSPHQNSEHLTDRVSIVMFFSQAGAFGGASSWIHGGTWPDGQFVITNIEVLFWWFYRMSGGKKSFSELGVVAYAYNSELERLRGRILSSRSARAI